MATYKLIQDIEADDHILGPLSLRQFIFALITAFFLYLDFICVVKGVVFMLVILGPPTLLVGFFAFPFHGDQPTEVWALGKLRFWFKPRQRLWNQSGVKELVTITVPKKVERVYTDGLSQVEVKSRLKALANTIDSRGWAVKHVSADAYSQNAFDADSDRLLNANDFAQTVSPEDQVQEADVLDDTDSPLARQFDTMINQSAQIRRQALIDQMSTAVPTTAQPAPVFQQQAQQDAQQRAADSWFTQPLSAPVQPITPIVDTAASLAEEEAIKKQLRERADNAHVSYGNMRTLQPGGAQPQAPPALPVLVAPSLNPLQPAPASSLPAPDPAILSLSRNDNLSVATLAREAQKNKGDGEVVVSLH